ncbi:hypothetical protein AAG906_013714 [Vitis piasezkii]
MAKGRNEEAKEMRHRNSTMKLNDTINWAEVHDTRDLAKIVLSRVIETLCCADSRTGSVLVGVEDVQWIQRKLMRVQVKPEYSPEELMDVAYDLEDVIDDLILRSAGKQRRIGNWESCLLIVRIHKKLELLKSKIPALPRLPIIIAAGANHDNYFEEMVWSDIFLLHDQNVANTIVSPVEQKKVMRVLDKFRSLNDFLTVELDACGMVWMEELSHVALSAGHESTVRISPQPTMQEPNLASFTDDVHALVKRLLTDDKSFRVIPIMGMEGIGKMTLAKLIFNNKDVLNHFPFGVWTSDGYEFHLRDKEKLMDSNLSQLGDVWNYHVESLIVLDDTHIPFLDHVLGILAESSNGSRMILTIHKIRDEESLALFTHALKKSILPNC